MFFFLNNLQGPVQRVSYSQATAACLCSGSPGPTTRLKGNRGSKSTYKFFFQQQRWARAIFFPYSRFTAILRSIFEHFVNLATCSNRVQATCSNRVQATLFRATCDKVVAPHNSSPLFYPLPRFLPLLIAYIPLNYLSGLMSLSPSHVHLPQSTSLLQSSSPWPPYISPIPSPVLHFPCPLYLLLLPFLNPSPPFLLLL